ncbi:hypothetical protein CYLTODRAFT_416707 [Cylindrobasidium torrendii FP15055 ss-10]|uniref:Uncharacterized protein n=1 Tax=Cylindrobasidium torrendii FP15055 ss-10 TaxID=1314674 RepID=A0A0D7BVP3_9AGAR|nr:hypothetical protein CYLTODRAFT_416707 [Cylindrobasidium torrendii FP15055 ss-10]
MVEFNNALLISGMQTSARPARRRVVSNPTLLERLPPRAFIEREAELTAPGAILRQLRRSPPPRDDDPSNSEIPASPTSSRHSRTGTSDTEATSPSLTYAATPTIPWKEPLGWEVLRAVERKDIEYLIQVRERAFHLLLRKTGDATPLLHAMRIGASHREVAIILLGAFSRWINNLDDVELAKPKTKTLLKALRTNLKLAIDYGLAQSQSDLTASFMQTLVMSEGDKWIHKVVANVVIALRAGTHGEPVQTANAAVRKFATRELGKADLIATLEDYVANATVDLLMMAAWDLVRESIRGPEEPLPTYFFARDDRVHVAFKDRIHRHDNTLRQKCGRRLRWQIRVLLSVLEGRTSTYRRKVELLTGELDCGDGV